MSIDIPSLLAQAHAEIVEDESGELATYIPALAEVGPDPCGIAMVDAEGNLYEHGDSQQLFSLQSVSKPFTYALTLSRLGFEAVDELVDVEPSGEAYNEISLNKETGKADNALINAGAIAATAMLPRSGRASALIDFYSSLAGRPLHADAEIAMQEIDNGHRNLALAHLMKGFGTLADDPEPAVRDYSASCATLVSARDLAFMAATLATGGIQPTTRERLIDRTVVGRVLSVMTLCGMYDDAGRWMVKVGLPGKSGVGGGVIAVAPGRWGIAAFSPRLDAHGSSVRGVRACEIISAALDLHLMSIR